MGVSAHRASARSWLFSDDGTLALCECEFVNLIIFSIDRLQNSFLANVLIPKMPKESRVIESEELGMLCLTDLNFCQVQEEI